MDYLIIFLLGISFASFLGALMFRIETKLSLKEMLFSRSHCDSCNRDLTPTELIPVLSWFIAKGKCKTCGVRIPIFYPLSELFLGISFMIIYRYNYINFWPYLFLMILFSLSYYDYISKTIPQWLTHLALIVGGIFFFLNFSNMRIVSLEYFVGLAVLFFIINRVKKSFGFGDILLLLFFALILNPLPYVVFLLTTLYLAAIGGIVMILKNRKNINSYLPLVPFMTVAYVLAPILENTYVQIYLRILNIN